MKGSRAGVAMASRTPADGLRGGYCRGPLVDRGAANIAVILGRYGRLSRDGAPRSFGALARPGADTAAAARLS